MAGRDALGHTGLSRESLMPISCSHVALVDTNYQPIRKKILGFQGFPSSMATLGFPLSIARVVFRLHRSIKMIQPYSNAWTRRWRPASMQSAAGDSLLRFLAFRCQTLE
jgi:hypothetical protein